MRVIIADDSALLREGLNLILGDAGHEVVEAVTDGDQLVTAALELRPDVIVTDVRMPPSFTDEGLRAAVEIRERWPQAPIMVLSQYVVDQYAETLFASGNGGVGYVLKERVAEIDAFMTSLSQVANGGTVLDPHVVTQLLRRKRDPLAALTVREREVLEAMAQGLSNQAIAARMTVTEGAVEKYTQRIFAKLDLGQDQNAHRRVLAVLRYLRDAR